MKKQTNRLVIFLITFTTAFSYGKPPANVANVNQIVRTFVAEQKNQFVATTNKRLQNESFARGEFFKGSVAEIEKASQILLRLRPHVVASPGGVTVIVGTGKSQRKILVKFIDPLLGKLQVDGNMIQIKKGMSFLQLAQAIGHPILTPILEEAKSGKEIKPKKTSSFHPLDIIAPIAWSDESGSVLNDLSKSEREKLAQLAASLTGVSVVAGAVVAGTGAAAGVAAATGAAGVAGAAGIAGAAAVAPISVAVVAGAAGAAGGAVVAGVAGAAGAAAAGAGVTAGIIKGGTALLGTALAAKLAIATAAVVAVTALTDVMSSGVYQLISLKDDNAFNQFSQQIDRLTALSCDRSENSPFEDGDFNKIRNFLQRTTLDNKDKNMSCYKMAQKEYLQEFLEKHDSWLYWKPSQAIYRHRLQSICDKYIAMLDCFSPRPGEQLSRDNHEEGGNRGSIKSDDLRPFYESLNKEPVLH